VNYIAQARAARLKVLDIVFAAQSSHIGSNFSIIDVLTVLFDKADLTKDKIILSAGWKAASFYYFLADKGLISKEELLTYNQEGSRLIGLTEPGVPGVHFAGGSMQMGLPAAVGFALSKKMKKEEGKVYCIMSDGELAGGMIWESALIASHHKLDNLVVIIDNNGLQAMGRKEDILKAYFPVGDGTQWLRYTIDGHNYKDLEVCFRQQERTRPAVIIANTIKGKGVSFMENDNKWHYLNIPEDKYLEAKQELSC
jgi:transketolase